MDAETRTDAKRAANEFEAKYCAKYEKAVASLRSDFEKLLTFYDFPA
jgi:transposase-like protein